MAPPVEVDSKCDLFAWICNKVIQTNDTLSMSPWNVLFLTQYCDFSNNTTGIGRRQFNSGVNECACVYQSCNSCSILHSIFTQMVFGSTQSFDVVAYLFPWSIVNVIPPTQSVASHVIVRHWKWIWARHTYCNKITNCFSSFEY